MAYTGIGSRQTPRLILLVMYWFALTMKSVCRSGAAPKADATFERGARKSKIFLPWRGFNGHKTGIWEYTEHQIAFAEYLVWKVYPVVVQKDSHMKLFRRNVFQVLDLCTCVEDVNPSKFVLCWTPDGCISPSTYNWGVTGGTGVAILVAWEFDVPVYNLARQKDMKMVLDHIGEFFEIDDLVASLKREGFYK